MGVRRTSMAMGAAALIACLGLNACSVKDTTGDKQKGTTVTTGIYRSIGQYQADFGAVFALMFLASLPVLIFYLALQKHFIKGLTGGAMKG